MNADIARDLERLRALVTLLHQCSCTTGCFIHGCDHTVRRIKANLHIGPSKILCFVCAQELQRTTGQDAVKERCDACGSWQAFEVQA